MRISIDVIYTEFDPFRTNRTKTCRFLGKHFFTVQQSDCKKDLNKIETYEKQICFSYILLKSGRDSHRTMDPISPADDGSPFEGEADITRSMQGPNWMPQQAIDNSGLPSDACLLAFLRNQATGTPNEVSSVMSTIGSQPTNTLDMFPPHVSAIQSFLASEQQKRDDTHAAPRTQHQGEGGEEIQQQYRRYPLLNSQDVRYQKDEPFFITDSPLHVPPPQLPENIGGGTCFPSSPSSSQQHALYPMQFLQGNSYSALNTGVADCGSCSSGPATVPFALSSSRAKPHSTGDGKPASFSQGTLEEQQWAGQRSFHLGSLGYPIEAGSTNHMSSGKGLEAWFGNERTSEGMKDIAEQLVNREDTATGFAFANTALEPSSWCFGVDPRFPLLMGSTNSTPTLPHANSVVLNQGHNGTNDVSASSTRTGGDVRNQPMPWGADYLAMNFPFGGATGGTIQASPGIVTSGNSFIIPRERQGIPTETQADELAKFYWQHQLFGSDSTSRDAKERSDDFQTEQQKQEQDDKTPEPVANDSHADTEEAFNETTTPTDITVMGAWSAASAELLGALEVSARERTNRLRKKAKDKPKRPLSAYNIFFKEERERILQEIPDDPAISTGSPTQEHSRGRTRKGKKPHGKIDFQSLAKAVGRGWHNLSADLKEVYKQKANSDLVRYKREMEEYIKSGTDEVKKEP